jgi:hypothetical protein
MLWILQNYGRTSTSDVIFVLLTRHPLCAFIAQHVAHTASHKLQKQHRTCNKNQRQHSDLCPKVKRFLSSKVCCQELKFQLLTLYNARGITIVIKLD